MGILDDAIREHLDLKRRHGAREAELKQLENEAFGPPSRPGEPDFPQPGAASPRDETDEVAVAEAEEETRVQPQPEPSADVGAPGAAAEAADAEGPQEGVEALREPEEPATGAEVGEGPLYDYAREEEFDLGGVELELEEELAIDDQEVAAEEAAAPRREQPSFPEDSPPEETLDDETPAAEIPVDETSVEEVSVEEEWEEEPGEAAEDEDVLEETPEFLRDAPEDEELWFEQGEPQDFDFEDEK
jgi:hypothetical protein